MLERGERIFPGRGKDQRDVCVCVCVCARVFVCLHTVPCGRMQMCSSVVVLLLARKIVSEILI
jgi:hypothetical protein